VPVTPGLPDGIYIFHADRDNLGKFWKALERNILLYYMPFGTFYGHLIHFKAMWYILWPFGIFYGHLVYLWSFDIFFPVLVCCSMKNLAILDKIADAKFLKALLVAKKVKETFIL
jgi:hypothetical protein